jgi:hypothetical protein
MRGAHKRIVTGRLEEMAYAPANQFEEGDERLGEMCFVRFYFMKEIGRESPDGGRVFGIIQPL